MTRGTRVGGIHAVSSALEYASEKILKAWLNPQRHDRRLAEIEQQLIAAGVTIEHVDRKKLDQLFDDRSHQGVVIEILLPSERTEKDLFEALDEAKRIPFYLVLDQVQDPNNLGACLRSADATGVDGIVVPKDRAAGITPAVCKVASGAAELVPLYRVTNLSRVLQQMKEHGLWIVGAHGTAANSAFETDLGGPLALVIGAEGHGLRRLTQEQCDLLVSLPMRGKVQSLNLSVAAGVLLYEVLRQRSRTALEQN